MRRYSTLFLCFVILLSISSCDASRQITHTSSSNEISTSQSDTNSVMSLASEDQADVSEYPYVDTDGRNRYQLFINGELTTTQHDPYSYPENPNGVFYPIVEVLSELGVECLFDEEIGILTTKINDKTMLCSVGDEDIKIGNKTLGGTAPEYIDGCIYVPSYTFMELLDAVVDFTSERSGVTLVTNLTINQETSGVIGLSISPETAGKTGEKIYTGNDICVSCGGTGRCLCPVCSGTGTVTQYVQNRNHLTGQLSVISSKSICTACGGSGRRNCIACGGSGKR